MTISFDVEIPQGLEPGDSFKVAAPRENKRGKGLKVTVPFGYHPGEELTLEHKGKLFNVTVPEGKEAGDVFVCPAPNNSFFQRTSVRVTCPDNKGQGDDITVELPDLGNFQFKATVPVGVHGGESFMIPVPTAEEACRQMAEDEAQKKAKKKELQAKRDARASARENKRAEHESRRNERQSRRDLQEKSMVPGRVVKKQGANDKDDMPTTLWTTSDGFPCTVAPGLLKLHTSTNTHSHANGEESVSKKTTLSYDGSTLMEVDTTEDLDRLGEKMGGASHTAKLSEDSRDLIVVKTKMKNGVDSDSKKTYPVADLIQKWKIETGNL